MTLGWRLRWNDRYKDKNCLIEYYNQDDFQVLIFPGSSLLAEIGGTLGVFLGFSFIAVWDGIQQVVQYSQSVCFSLNVKE